VKIKGPLCQHDPRRFCRKCVDDPATVEAEAEYFETHCAYCEAHEADPVGCPECRAENFGGTD